jgi:hypothetical protein
MPLGGKERVQKFRARAWNWTTGPALVWRRVARAQGKGDVHCCPWVAKEADCELVLDWCYTSLSHLCSCVQLGDVESLNLGGLRRAISVIGAAPFSLNHRQRSIVLQEEGIAIFKIASILQ